MADNPLDKHYEHALTVIQRDNLISRLPNLEHKIAEADIPPGPLQQRLRQIVIDDITTYEATRREQPFLARLSQEMRGTFAPLTQQVTGKPVLFDTVDFASHTLISGATGSTKTACAKNIITTLQEADPTVQVCYVDPNNDWQRQAINDPRCLIITEHTPLCITTTPSFLRQDFYDQLKAKTFADAFYGAMHTQRLWNDTEKEARNKHPQGHSISDIRALIARPPAKSASYQERDTRTNMLGRADQFDAAMPGTYNAKPPGCITMEGLCNHPVYWPMPSRFNTHEFLIALWVQVRMHYHTHHRHSGLRTLIVMDEGLTLWQADAGHHITGTPLLDHAVSQARSKGIGFLITTTSTRKVSQMIRANTNLQITMRLVDGAEVEEARRTFRLNPDQTTYLHERLTRGECLVRLSHKYPETLLCTFPKPEETTVDPDEWKAAQERANSLLPGDASGAPERPAPETPEPQAQSRPERPSVIALNATVEALLRFIPANGGIATVSEAYDNLGIHYSAGDAAKTTALQLGLLSATPIIARSGRGGRAVALQLTPAGYERLGITAPRRSRGGGAQSEYLIQNLHKLLAGSSIEVTLG